jgi:putative ABC transport system permease protein
MRAPDTFFMSLGAILSNKLRSVLTLVGIVAGVASIIAVMTAISVIQGTMEKEMSVLGTQTFQVQKWPAGGFNSDSDRRRAMRRPPVQASHRFPGRRNRRQGACDRLRAAIPQSSRPGARAGRIHGVEEGRRRGRT